MLKVIIVGYDKMLSSLVAGALESGHKIVGVLRCDRYRIPAPVLFIKDIFAPSIDLSFIKSYGIYDIKAHSVNSQKFKREFKKLKADIILVGSWGERFNKSVLDMPEFGCVNCHPSLLPQNRGPNPYFWAIYQGKTRTGVTFHLMDEGYDTGKILAQAGVEIGENMNAGELKNKVCQVAKLMIGPLLSELEGGIVVPIPQDENCASYEEALCAKNFLIDFNRSLKDVKNHIRALLGIQVPYCKIDGFFHKIKNYAVFEGTRKFGEGKKSRVFDCLDGKIEVEIS
jgi:methionyl-tRNA formyltransferase